VLCTAGDADGALRLHRGGKSGKVLRINGWINLAFGAIGVVAALVVSPWGLSKHPVWTSVELYKVFCAVVAFLIWAAVGWFTLRQSQQRWWLAALCPLGLTLLIGFAIPNLVVDSKQPQSLVDTVREPLQESRFVLANNVGVASGLAWELKRNDIVLYGQSGELRYGLDYPDVKDRFVGKDDFPQWLEEHRQQGRISMVILLSKNDDLERLKLPKPDSLYIQGRLAYLQYLPQ
jgi:4-amino-4-deoxy-L-arabinose transferase